MTPSASPPFTLEQPAPRPGERLLRWGLAAAAHGALLYGILQVSLPEAALPPPASISVRLLPAEEAPKPALPPPPRTAPVRKAAPLPQPVLTAKAAPEAPTSFAIAPQPPAPPPAPITVAPAAVPAPAPALIAARFDADYLHNPKPAYPPLARRNGEEGKVLLRVKVSPDGAAVDVELKQTSGYPRLDNAAREAVEKWRFIPAKRGDEAVEAWVTVPVTFNLG